jgi:hypothetical protein
VQHAAAAAAKCRQQRISTAPDYTEKQRKISKLGTGRSKDG